LIPAWDFHLLRRRDHLHKLLWYPLHELLLHRLHELLWRPLHELLWQVDEPLWHALHEQGRRHDSLVSDGILLRHI
jgi:hypothetical protein